MKKIFYFIVALLFVSCVSNEDIDVPTVESNKIPEDTINMYVNDPDVIWDEEFGWVHINCIETF